jgi:hypothetical protein
MTDSNAARKLAEALRKHPRDLQPERDLWPGIAHAIEAPAHPHWQRPAALAASVVLLFGLSLYFGARQPEPALFNPQLDAFLDALRNEHRTGKEALLVQYQGQQPSYADWEVQMQQLEQAEQAVYRALQEDPANMELLKILRQVQTRQIKLIDAVFEPRLTTI